MANSIFVFTKTVAATGTPEALGAESTEVSSLEFVGQKAYGSDNATDVHIQLKTLSTGAWADAITISPGQAKPLGIDVSEVRRFSLAEFRVRVQTNGDGVRCICAAI